MGCIARPARQVNSFSGFLQFKAMSALVAKDG
jgi:hypothetical protein